MQLWKLKIKKKDRFFHADSEPSRELTVQILPFSEIWTNQLFSPTARVGGCVEKECLNHSSLLLALLKVFSWPMLVSEVSGTRREERPAHREEALTSSLPSFILSRRQIPSGRILKDSFSWTSFNKHLGFCWRVSFCCFTRWSWAGIRRQIFLGLL